MKVIYLFAKLFIVLVKISLPLIQEIVLPFLHDVHNALNSVTEKENNKKIVLPQRLTTPKYLVQWAMHILILPLPLVPIYLLSNISKLLT